MRPPVTSAGITGAALRGLWTCGSPVRLQPKIWLWQNLEKTSLKFYQHEAIQVAL